MSSTSPKQKRFMYSVLAYKLGKTDNVSQEVKDAAHSMSKKQIEDFLKEENLSDDQMLDETTSFGVFGAGGFPATPVAFAKDSKNWRLGNESPIKGSKIIEPNAKQHVQGVKSYKTKKLNESSFKYHKSVRKDDSLEFMKLFSPDLILESINNPTNELKPHDVEILDVDGKKFEDIIETHPTHPMKVKFYFDNEETDLQDEYELIFNLKQYTDYILDKYDYSEDYNLSSRMGMEQAINNIIFDTVEHNLDQPLQHYILDHFNDAKTVEKTGEDRIEEEDTMTEHHIESRENLTTFILDHTEEYKEHELDQMTYDDLYKLYLDVEANADLEEPTGEKHKEIIVGGLEEEIKLKPFEDANAKLAEINKKQNTIMTTNKNINEESKPGALTQLDRIKKENEKNEKEAFSNLNTGVQDQIKDSTEGGKFDYEYDKDSLKKDEIPHYQQSDEPTAEFVDMNRGRLASDLDFDLEPSKKWMKDFEERLGPEGFKKFKEKARLRKLEKRYMRDVETEIHPDHVQDQINLTPSLKESIKMTGYYLDKYNQKKFITVDVNNLNEITELNESLTEVRFDGMGNTYSSKIENSEFVSLNEAKEAIANYKYFINFADSSVVKMKATAKKLVNEDYKKEFNKFLNHKSSDFTNNKKNNQAKFDK